MHPSTHKILMGRAIKRAKTLSATILKAGFLLPYLRGLVAPAAARSTTYSYESASVTLTGRLTRQVFASPGFESNFKKD
jgi:hypothetical protein